MAEDRKKPSMRLIRHFTRFRDDAREQQAAAARAAGKESEDRWQQYAEEKAAEEHEFTSRTRAALEAAIKQINQEGRACWESRCQGTDGKPKTR